jgi:hypothetical protein
VKYFRDFLLGIIVSRNALKFPILKFREKYQGDQNNAGMYICTQRLKRGRRKRRGLFE